LHQFARHRGRRREHVGCLEGLRKHIGEPREVRTERVRGAVSRPEVRGDVSANDLAMSESSTASTSSRDRPVMTNSQTAGRTLIGSRPASDAAARTTPSRFA
jgi:hypothetical protein